MSHSATTVVVLAALVAVVLVPPSSEAAVSCSDVFQKLMPCLGYLQSNGIPAPPQSCCNGISSLMAEAHAKADRQTACDCLKRAAGGISGIDFKVAETLPNKCGVKVPYKISPNTDCNKVN